jgi:hypothetical protein
LEELITMSIRTSHSNWKSHRDSENQEEKVIERMLLMITT